MSFLNYACAVGNLVACVSDRPASPLAAKTSSALLGTMVVGDILELTEVRMFRVKPSEEDKEVHAEEVRWSPERVSIGCDGLQLERVAEGNVLVQKSNFQEPQTFTISGRANSAFNIPGSFKVIKDILVFCSESGWTCVIAVTPKAKLVWQPGSTNSGVFRFEFEETKEFCFVVTTDTKEKSAIDMAKGALKRPHDIFHKSEESWRRYFQENVPPYPLIEERWKPLYEMCWYVLRSNSMTYGQPPLEKRFTCPSKFTYRHQWLWDSVFATIGLRWLRDKTAAVDEFENLLSHPRPDGMLSHDLSQPCFRSLFYPKGEGGASIFAAPPVLGLGIEKVSENTKEQRLLEKAFPVMSRYVDWFFRTLDSDGDNLAAIRHTHESSWDNSPRWDEAMKEGRGLVPSVETVDTNCLLVCELQRLSRWARMLGKDNEANEFDQRAARIVDRIRSVFWDEKDQFFYDVDEVTHTKMRVKTPAAFFTLWGGIATKEQEKALVAHLTNPDEFWTKYPVPSVAKNEPTFISRDMWRGPTWVNINWVIIQGLRMRGHNELAKELANRTLNMMLSQGRPEVREWYDPDTGEPCGALNYGWSAGVGIDLMIDTLKEE